MNRPTDRPNDPKFATNAPPRESIARGGGSTASERYLARIAEKSFLNLWSYPNVFIDKKADRKGDGKELCDLLVVCGDDIIIFSDKTIAWPGGDDNQLAWKRWYKRAIAKSVDQIRGAERWISNFPDRLFLDRNCTKRLPIPLPPPERRRVHGVVVALGAGTACKQYYSGGIGSLRVQTEISGNEHWQGENVMPFTVGDVNPAGPYVHVLDDATLDIVLGELDTITDLTVYFGKKERIIRSGQLASAEGEEDMVAYYMTHMNLDEEHDFTREDGTSWAEGERFALEGGIFGRMRQNRQYLAKKRAERDSYVWDRLITQFTTHMLEGTSVLFEGQSSEISIVEEGVRQMALVPRYKRRIFGDAITEVLHRGHITDRFTRAMLPGPTEPDRTTGFFFMTLKVPEWQLAGGYQQYRETRIAFLETYALALHQANPYLERVVGIAMEPPDPKEHRGSSEDLIYMERPEWSDELIADLEERKQALNIMNPANYKEHSLDGNEFPDDDEQDYRAKKASSNLLFTTVSAYTSDETTPKEITPLIEKFASQILKGVEPIFVPVKHDPYGLYGYCSDGVHAKIKHDGGSIRFGWTLWEWPGVLLTAEFHSVWISPDGDFIDITPKPARETRILFLPDDSFAPEFDFDDRPLNKRVAAVPEPNASDYAESRIREMKPSQLQYEGRRATKAGMMLKEWIGAKMPPDTLYALVVELVTVCDEVDRLMDSAPTVGKDFAIADRKLTAANEKKARLIQKVKALKL